MTERWWRPGLSISLTSELEWIFGLWIQEKKKLFKSCYDAVTVCNGEGVRRILCEYPRRDWCFWAGAKQVLLLQSNATFAEPSTYVNLPLCIFGVGYVERMQGSQSQPLQELDVRHKTILVNKRRILCHKAYTQGLHISSGIGEAEKTSSGVKYAANDCPVCPTWLSLQ
ncbi:hypothetical protein Y1Q_0019071 [Alligator mississippiensis]|uniref:Uncharacterized protein n=1 Tax=Alligator mississippiensis TaxID=8496 RepID=A0A151N145_ALLMI|nr:hypothetical protein Y1Q_0019071 [Alligator mississippiensis]